MGATAAARAGRGRAVSVRFSDLGTPAFAAWAEDARGAIDGRKVIASISGGKDSVTVALLLREAEIPFTAVHMATGWEASDTDRYLAEYLPGIIGPIITLRSPIGGMEEMVLNKRSFPSRAVRFCTEKLKVLPLAAYIDAQIDECVNVVGIRHDESKARAKLPEWENSDGEIRCLVWRPITEWPLDDVVQMHTRHGVMPNPLYLRGRSRVGCNPCIFARKDEIRKIADDDPAAIDRVRRLEVVVGDGAEVRVAARQARAEHALATPGITVDEAIDLVRQGGHRKDAQAALGRAWAVRDGLIADWREWWNRPAWFSNPSTNTGAGTAGACWPIDKVVQWSRTSHGGRQFELFAPPPSEDGCMRWGLCETVESDGDMPWADVDADGGEP